MAYNLTEVFQSNNIADVFVGVNNLTNNLLAVFILIIVFVISYLNTSSVEYTRKFMSASFICTIVGSLMWFGGYITWYYVSISPLIFLIALIIDKFD